MFIIIQIGTCEYFPGWEANNDGIICCLSSGGALTQMKWEHEADGEQNYIKQSFQIEGINSAQNYEISLKELQVESDLLRLNKYNRRLQLNSGKLRTKIKNIKAPKQTDTHTHWSTSDLYKLFGVCLFIIFCTLVLSVHLLKSVSSVLLLFVFFCRETKLN